jgi:hypothetical protein
MRIVASRNVASNILEKRWNCPATLVAGEEAAFREVVVHELWMEHGAGCGQVVLILAYLDKASDHSLVVLH